MSKVLIVDDSAPSIIYSGNWSVGSFVGVNAYDYNSTLHKSTSPGDQLSFSFFGTGVSLYGTLDAPGIHGNPVVSFSIDGAPSTHFNATGPNLIEDAAIVTSNVLFYQSPGLSKATHTLNVVTESAIGAFYVDFLTVSTGSDTASGNIVIDDRDVSIAYNGTWPRVGIPLEYLGTTTATPAPSSGSATFRFNGTGVTAFATIPVNNGTPESRAVLGITLDGVVTSTYNGPSVPVVMRHVPIFHTEGLSNTAEHTLVLSTINPTLWFLDKIVYSNDGSSWSTGSSGGFQGSPNTGPADGGEPTPSSPLNIGAIAGGVAGAIVGILAIAGILFLLRRRRKLHSKQEANLTEEVIPAPPSRPEVSPFTSAITYLPAGKYSSPGQGPAVSRETTADTSGQPLLSPASSAPYYVTDPSAYSSSQTASQSTEASPNAGRQDGINNVSANPGLGHGVYGHPNSLYPSMPLGVGGGRGRREIVSTYPSQTGSPEGDTPATTGQTTGRKGGFIGHSPPNDAPARTTHRAFSPPSTTVIEEDSGIRIPRTSPPVYTPD